MADENSEIYGGNNRLVTANQLNNLKQELIALINGQTSIVGKSSYLKQKAIQHSFSKQQLVQDDSQLDQNVKSIAGHTISYENVRSQDIPIIESIQKRDEEILITTQSGKKCVKAELSGVLYFLDKKDISQIFGTSYESYEIPVPIELTGFSDLDFIDPSDKPISTIKLSDGYSFRLFSYNSVTKIYTEIPKSYGWEFDSYSGIIHFYDGIGPGSEKWVKSGYGIAKIQCFIYIGKYIKGSLYNFKNTLNAIQNNVDTSLSVQPYRFTNKQMTSLTGYQSDLYVKKSFIIPGFVFNTISQNGTEKNLCYNFYKDGETQIVMDIKKDQNGVEIDETFLSFAFKTKDGSLIKLNKTISYDTPAFSGITTPPSGVIDIFDEPQTDMTILNYNIVTPKNPLIITNDNLNINITLNTNQ